MSKRSRNAPCPCGSGKKYKRCHAYSTANRLAIDSRKQPIAPSVAGVSPKANAIIEITRHLANKARRDIAGNSAISASRMIGTFWFAKAAKSFDAACLLWEHGYWQDAAAVARTILELAYQARYFKTDPSTFAPQFFAHAENQLHDLYRKFYGFADEQLKPEISEYFR